MANQSDYFLEELGVVLGYKCNLNCAHCLTNSSSSRTEALSEIELKSLVVEIRNALLSGALKQIMFTGGEPTLYLDIVSSILSNIKNEINNTVIAFTTNGSFIRNQKRLKKIVELEKIDRFRLSIDEFHMGNLSIADLKKIKEFCAYNNILLDVNCVQGSPLAYKYRLICLKENIEFNFSHLIYAGRGANLKQRALNKYRQDLDYNKSCNLLDRVLYVPSRGFTRCSRNLCWNSNKYDHLIFGQSISEVFSMPHYRHIQATPFSRMKDLVGKDDNDTYLNKCELCEEYHKCII